MADTPEGLHFVLPEPEQYYKDWGYHIIEE